MTSNLFVTLVMNIGLDLFTCAVLAEIRPIRQLLISREESSIWNTLLIAVTFGLLGCVATMFGLPVQGAIANTRVVCISSAAILGGPWAGLLAGLLAGVHRFFYDTEGFTSLGCAVGTFWFGVVGAVASRFYRRYPENRGLVLVGCAAVGEVCQVGWLFLLARPVSAVVALERAIFLPKLLVNCVGIVLLFAVLERFTEARVNQGIEDQTKALYIADKCLPFLRNGLSDEEAMQKAADVVGSELYGYRVIITDDRQILAASGLEIISRELPVYAKTALQDNKPVLIETPSGKLFHRKRQDDIVCVPLRMDSGPVGTLTLIINQGFIRAAKPDTQLAEALSGFISTGLELHNLDKQIELRRRAEIRAFQSQINPHFFYNALNTISSLCRTNPDEARRLLQTLAAYYRQSLLVNEDFVNLDTELQNVENYLIITIARFGDDMHISCDFPTDAGSFRVPPLILQPLVENAVRHGRTHTDERYVNMKIYRKDGRMFFEVSDKGHGFPEDVLRELANPDTKRYTGLFNVAKRLRSLYGEEGSLHVNSTPGGSCVWFSLPLEQKDETTNREAKVTHEDSGY